MKDIGKMSEMRESKRRGQLVERKDKGWSVGFHRRETEERSLQLVSYRGVRLKVIPRLIHHRDTRETHQLVPGTNADMT